MATTQTFETIIKLNAQQAKNEMAALQKTIDELKKKKTDALNSPNTSAKDINKISKEIKTAEAALKAYSSSVAKTINTVNNLSTASLGDIEKAAREVRKAMKQVTTPEDYNALNQILQHCKDRMDFLKDSTVQSLKEMQNLNNATANLGRVLGDINGASLNQLTAAADKLQKKLADIAPNTDAFKKTSEDLQKIKTRIQQINDAQKTTNLTIDKYNQEIEAAKKSALDLTRENKLIEATLNNISRSSLRDLETSLKLVNERIKDTGHNSKEFDELADKAKRLKAEIAAINSEQEVSKSKWSKFVNFFNVNWGIITQGIGAFTGISMTIRKCSADFALMDEQMVDVIKYTGLTKQQVEQLNETFKRMDTRTPREKLNQLAGDAGRLGITTQEAVKEFVDAADKINVALGDDLGDDAVKNIGKLAQMFGDDKTKGLRGAMLATGSVVNELAQSSSASAGYLVDFTARLAGVGKQAGLTQQQIMGFASVLDQNMQQDEAAATAMQNLIAKMFQEPAKFASLAGKSIKEFSTLLKTDANEALLQFFGAMKKQGGFDKLAPMFDKMGMDGSRCVAVFSVMADKLTDIKTAQDIANRAYADGSSVINEFNTQMSSAQAKLDMAKKRFKDLSIELGEELQPVVQYTISSSALLVKTLYQIIVFTKSHISTLVTLAATIAAVTAVYEAKTIAIKLNTAAMATAKGVGIACDAVYKVMTITIGTLKVAFFLLTGQIKKAKAAIDVMRTACVANPYAAMLTVVLSLAAGIYYLVKSIRSHNKAAHDNMLAVRKLRAAQKDMIDAQREVNQSTAEEKTRISQLTNIINSNVYSYDEKKRAMIALEKIVPGYHRNLNNEAKLTAENNKALAEYAERLNNAAMAQALFSRMVQLQGKKFDLDQEIARHKFSAKAVQAEIDRHPDYYNAYETTYNTSGGLGGPSSTRNVIPTQANIDKHRELNMWNNAVKKAEQGAAIIEARIENINKYLKNNVGVAKEFNALMVKGGSSDTQTPPDWNPNTSTSNGEYVDTKQQKKAEAAAKKREQKLKAACLAEIKIAKDKTDKEQANNIMAYSMGQKTYNEYIDAQHDIAIRGYETLIDIHKKYNSEYGQFEEKIANERQKREADHSKTLLSDIEHNRQQEIDAAYADFYDKNASIYQNEEALNERLFEIDMSALADRMAVFKEGSEEWLNTRDEMTQRENERQLYLQQHYADLLAQYRADWASKNIKEQERITLNGLDLLHEKALLKEEEYQQMLKQIKLHYREQEAEEQLRNSANEQFKRNAHSAYNTASNEAKTTWSNNNKDGVGINEFFTSDVDIYKSTLDNIRSMEQQGLISHKEAMAAMVEATANMCSGLVAKFLAAMDAISPLMSAMSSYYSAQSDYEVTVTEKKYEKLIDAAGNNSVKAKKLEEKKEKEIAKIKTKYARKQASMQIAQAIAQTAISAIAAYSSAMQGVPYPANLVLAPIAAGIAAATGALQIATIKKQQQAQEAGYYEGGFTGGSRYRHEAGVVHEGEFVANHNAVNNTNILPALRLIDEAQRNNTVSSLTAADISRSLGQGAPTIVSAPAVTVNTDNSALNDTLADARDVIDRLSFILADGIHADVYIDGERGIAHNLELFNKLKSHT